MANKYLDIIEGQKVVVSFMTLAELALWAERPSWGAERRRRLSQFLANFTICHSDESLCESWASIRHQAFSAGHPIEVADAWIAATAVSLDVPLVTHNRKHFDHIDRLTLLPARP